MTESPPPPTGEQSDAQQAAASEPVHHFLVQAPVPALDVDGLRAVTIGLISFAVACVITAVFYPQLEASGNGWWLGVSVSGFGLGLVGLGYCLYRRQRRRAGRWDRD